jgi:hypothetical protein
MSLPEREAATDAQAVHEALAIALPGALLFGNGRRADGAQHRGVRPDGGELPRQVGDIEAVLFVHADDERLTSGSWLKPAPAGCGQAGTADSRAARQRREFFVQSSFLLVGGRRRMHCCSRRSGSFAAAVAVAQFGIAAAASLVSAARSGLSRATRCAKASGPSHSARQTPRVPELCAVCLPGTLHRIGGDVGAVSTV